MITVTPNPLVNGGTAHVCVSGSSHSDKTITVSINDSGTNNDTLNIDLDQEGYGCNDWPVPDWAGANFNYSTCDEVFRIIVPAAE